MIYRKPRLDEGEVYESVANHPLQALAWGEFRAKTGVKVERLIGFEESEPKTQMQVSFHPIPKIPLSVGYCPRGIMLDDVGLAALRELGRRENAIFIKLEPDVASPPLKKEVLAEVKKELESLGLVAGRPLFTKYSFVIDLTKSEDELLAAMKPKTRYNLKIAQKHGVEIVEDNSEAAFEKYLALLKQTTKRQKFYAHSEKYQRLMWQFMNEAKIARIMLAEFQGKTLAAWILFGYKQRWFYPYGASSRENREVMASNLLMWEAMRLGKRLKFQTFDLWGALGPDPDPNDPWLGFHNFKAGYGGELAEFVGTYDLVINPSLYRVYRLADRWRWRWLRLKNKIWPS